MRIQDLSSEVREGAATLRATIVWEERARPAQEIFFEVRPDPAAGRPAEVLEEPDSHPFLLAAAVAALRKRERRIAVAGAVSPMLERGLRTALETLARWYHPGRPPPRIEASGGLRPGRPDPEAATGLMLSGGLDSLAALRLNRLQLPRHHPRSVRVGVFVDGFDINASADEDQTEFAERAFASLERAVGDEGLELLRVRTNLRVLPGDWAEESHGAALAAVAHACRPRVGRMAIAAGPSWSILVPHGSHPILDRHYSSESMEVEHVGASDTRVDKARLLGDWPRALDELRVCWAGIRVGGPLNCGACHKCVLTMLALVAVGRLGACRAFPCDDLTPEQVAILRRRVLGRLDFLAELVEPLRLAGRADLAAAVEARRADPVEEPATRRPRGARRAGAAVASGWRAARSGVSRLLGSAP